MKKLNVLIIEDSIYAADINIRQIKRSGFMVEHTIVTNSSSMKTELEKQKWDLILSDNSMPNFNAIRALQERNLVDRTVPFIIVSEQITQEELNIAYSNGCNGFIPKEDLSQLGALVTYLFKE